MKKLLIIFTFTFILFSFLMADTQSILGKWKLGNLEITFNTNYTYIWKDSHGVISGKYKLNGTFLTMYYNGKGSQYLVLIKGNTLRLTDASGNVITLKRVTKSEKSKNNVEKLYGTWAVGNIKLVLKKSGEYIFGPSSGRFEATSEKIIMHDKKGNTAYYDYLLIGDTLKIRDSKGNVLPLKRVKESNTSNPSYSATNKNLVGKWYFKRNYRILVAFSPDGKYIFATDKGTYRADGKHIYFKSHNGRTSTYQYEISGNTLYLTDPNGNVLEFIRGN